MSIMNAYEEDLDDFPAENRKTGRIIGWNIPRRIDRSTAGSGITTKIPPLFDGSTSWF